MVEQMQKKVAGVIGGMGPDATVVFMAKVIARTEAKADQYHIRMIIDHNPKVPNRIEAIQGVGEDIGAHLAEMSRQLERAGADFLVMVCNTAHAFKTDIVKSVEIPIVSIIDEVIAALKNTYSENTKIGVMAAQGCLEADLYQQALVEAGFQPVLWSNAELVDFMSILYKVKCGDTGEKVTQDTLLLANSLVKKGAEVMLAGCTEIPLVINTNALSVPMLVSTDVLLDRVIEYSLGHDIISS